VLYALTIFLSAFLLFQVQLVLAKQLLPWFGGTPTVWTTCQLFFQINLLAGYVYAHSLARRWGPRQQGRIHLVVLSCAAAALAATCIWSGMPLLAPEALRPSGTGRPIALLLLTLTLTVGLPFFVLSSTGPLLQHWHSHSANSLDRTYRLYAISNVGSLLGLMTYPFGVERALDLEQQAGVWVALFAAFAVGSGVLGWRAGRAGQLRQDRVLEPVNPMNTQADPAEAPQVPLPLRRWLWLLLSFCGSAMFLATTNQLSLEVASVPFVWVLPLSLYLLAFIVSFDRPGWYSRRWTVLAAALATVVILALTVFAPVMRVSDAVIAYGAFLTLFCWVCHAELARLRPDASGLTHFYLLIAVGGAAGGAFVGLVAPTMFKDVWEFHFAVLFGWAVLGTAWLADRNSALHSGDRWQFTLFAGIVCTFLTYFLILHTGLRSTSLVARYDWRVPLTAGALLALLLAWTLRRSRLTGKAVWPRALVLLVILIAAKSLHHRVQSSSIGTQFGARDFFGVVRIHIAFSEGGRAAKVLMDGTTVHGVQLLPEELRSTPTSYYGPSTGIAAAMRLLTGTTQGAAAAGSGPLRVGILGMGAGVMAAFGRPGDQFRYYELNPTIVALSQGADPHFTFVRDSAAATVDIVVGDGRISLERELLQGAQGFDLLVMDAFSSDAVPVHLLTEEAFRTYTAHLRNDRSIVAVNITNRHLDLEPVVTAAARRVGLRGIRVDAAGDAPVRVASSWILLTRDARLFEGPTFATARHRPLDRREILFTDRYSNLLRVLK
jgi:hypothetical protein